MKQPESNEYGEFYARYIKLVPEGDVVGFLERQLEKFLPVLEGISEEKSEYRYAPGKWSIKELMAHIADTERIFAYRALSIARGDETPLPGMEQDDYVTNFDSKSRTFRSVLDEFRFQRLSNMLLFRSFDENIAMRRGTASDNPFTVQAVVYIMAGHVRHHQLKLDELYLS
ncbi:MAG: DinB family protein [bacterium]|nr:DinB family protein [bacterium]